MDSQIETHRVIQFANNMFHLAQEAGVVVPRLGVVDSFIGKSKMYDRLGLATAQDKTGRNEDTPNLSIAHTRRMLTTVTRHWGTLVDNKDKVQQIHNLTSEYSLAAQNALARRLDEVAVAAAFGTAKTGEDGTGSQILGNAQKVTAVSTGLTYANVQMLRKMKFVLDHGKAKGKRTLFYSADMLEALLATTEATSGDFVMIKSLIDGEITRFLGFDWAPYEDLSDVLASTYDADTYVFSATTGLYSLGGTALLGTEKVCLAMIEGALQPGKNPNMLSRVSERSDKCYSAQIYAALDFGAVRMEEARVVMGIYKA